MPSENQAEKPLETQTLLKQLEALSQKLGKEFDPLKKYVHSTLIHDTCYTPADTAVFTELDIQKATSFAFENTNLENKLSEELRYELRQQLGEGGMGVVQLVFDRLLNREVAQKQSKIKSLVSGSLSEKQKYLLWRLSKEAEITAKLEHPNIVPLYDMQQKGMGEIQFTMRKITGMSLRELLKKIDTGEEPYEERKLLGIFLKVCDAISYAHSRRVIHRDLKPDNIMVGSYGEVYVMDWGISKELDGKEENEKKTDESFFLDKSDGYSTVGGMGTPGYMPPEQSENAKDVTTQSDIYALGKILRELFTLKSPLEELKHQVKTKINVTKTILKKEQTLREIPKDVASIIAKATEEQSKNRYREIKTFVEDIENYLQNYRVSVREYGLFELLQKLIKRNKKSIRLVSTTAFFLGIIIFYVQIYQHRQGVNENRKILEYWLEELKTPEEGEREQALLEINKMKEKEIWEDLLQKTEEGVLYYLQQKRNTSQDEYYKTITEMLGWLENEKSGPFLMSSLERMQKKLSHYPREKRPVADELYMVTLAKALVDSKSKGFLLHFNRLRSKMGGNSLFEEGTKLTFKILLKNEGGLEKIDQLRCKDPFDYLSRGNIKRNAHFFYEAIADYTQAIQLDPEFAEAYLNRGNAKKMLANFKGAIEDYNQALLLNPQYAIAYNNRGSAKKELGNIQGAIEDYNQALLLNPQYVSAYNNRGVAKHLLGDFEGEIADYTQSLLLDPQGISTYHNRGTAKKELGDFKGAIEDYNQLLKFNPANANVYNDRGIAKVDSGDFKGAIEDYNQTLLLNPQHENAYTNRGSAKYELGDFKGAIEDYNQTLLLNPQHENAYNNRGTTKIGLGDIYGAIEDYSQVLILNPKSTDAYHSRGSAKLLLKDFKGVIEDYNQLLLLSPKSSDAYLNRGSAKYALGNFKEAIEDFEHCLRLNPQKLKALNGFEERLSSLLLQEAIKSFRKKEYLECKNYLLRFQQYFPQHSQADRVRKMLEQVYEKLK